MISCDKAELKANVPDDGAEQVFEILTPMQFSTK
jgi:hypothetical protein